MDKDYMYYEYTNSICPSCMEIVPAKVVIMDNKVYLKKTCNKHGEMLEILEENADYHFKKRLFNKPGTNMKIHKEIKNGCPYDCGICPQHDQHGCIALIEITNQCNLNCPLCYADSNKGNFLSLKKIEEMLDFFIESENGNGEILQISGGEPTLHPQILDIIKLARSKNFKYVMLNTNGVRLSQDEDFVKQLSQFESGFEVYLQFDGFKKSTYNALRGQNIYPIKEKALNLLSKYNIATTLVCTVAQGVNDDELGEIFSFALDKECIRGINFQPVSLFGRIDVNVPKNRVTLSGVLSRLEKQTQNMLKVDDFIPLPCNVERVAITYLYKDRNGSFVPITRNEKIQNYLSLINNTFVFTIEDVLKTSGQSLSSIMSCECFKFLKDFKSMIPKNFFSLSKLDKKKYIDNNTFRISVTSFVDAYNFDIKSMQKECIHVVTPDLQKIPFSAYNMIYRNRGEKNE